MAFWREFAEFVGGRLVSLLVEVQGEDYLVKHGFSRSVMGITGGAAKIVITVVVILINYLMSKFLGFSFKGGALMTIETNGLWRRPSAWPDRQRWKARFPLGVW